MATGTGSLLIREPQKITRLRTLIEEALRARPEHVSRYVEPLAGTLEILKSRRPHIVSGRRGSGKTSLLQKARADLLAVGSIVAFVDVEGYKQNTLADGLIGIMREILEGCVESISLLERSADVTAAQNRIKGALEELENLLEKPEDQNITRTNIFEEQENSTKKGGGGLNISAIRASGELSADKKLSDQEKTEAHFSSNKLADVWRFRTKFAAVLTSLHKTLSKDVYLMLDDLYHLPRAYQPAVLDYFHSFGKGANIWLKVGTVRHRTEFRGFDPVRKVQLGLHIGNDAGEINLDKLLERFVQTREFLTSVISALAIEAELRYSDLIQDPTVELAVCASGGNARDFLNLIRFAFVNGIERVSRSIDEVRPTSPRISNVDIYSAINNLAHEKAAELNAELSTEEKQEIERRLAEVLEFCIANKTSCFLVNDGAPGGLRSQIEALMDAKYVHHLKSGIKLSYHPKEAYTAYIIDMSQYVVGAGRLKQIKEVDLSSATLTSKLSEKELVFSGAPT